MRSGALDAVLQALAARQAAGDDVDAELDALLGTALPERDVVAEADWEANYDDSRHDAVEYRRGKLRSPAIVTEKP